MKLESQKQLERTREKLRLLEQTCEETQRDSSGSAHSRQLTLRSLKGLINQLKEEITRHEARTGTRR